MKVQIIKKMALLSIVALFYAHSAEAQLSEKPKFSQSSIYADVSVGIIMHAAVNLEVLLSSGKKTAWYGRMGGGIAGIAITAGGPGGLVAITMLNGTGSKHFEMNAGVYIVEDNRNGNVVIPLINFGYRYQEPDGGLIFRSFISPLLSVGVGIGYAF